MPKPIGFFSSCLNRSRNAWSRYTAACAAFDLSSNTAFHDGKPANENGLRIFTSRVSGSGEVCGRAPRRIIGATLRSDVRSASEMSSRSNIAMNVIGRALSASMKSSRSSSESSITPICFVIAISIAPNGSAEEDYAAMIKAVERSAGLRCSW